MNNNIINYNYFCRESISTLPLYKSLVPPHLEYAVQFWSHLQRDIIKIEKIQRKASKMIPEIRHHSYSQWLKDLNLISLEKEDYVDNSLKYSSINEGSTMPQQKDFRP